MIGSTDMIGSADMPGHNLTLSDTLGSNIPSADINNLPDKLSDKAQVPQANLATTRDVVPEAEVDPPKATTPLKRIW